MIGFQIIGNLTRDPELRFTASGTAVVSFSVAHNNRRPDGAGGFVEDEPIFMECRAWREMAENIAASLVKGDRVIVAGRLESRTWEQDGQKRTALTLNADAVGPDLRFATAKVAKMARVGKYGPADDEWNSASKTRPAPVMDGGEPDDGPAF
jgi:single-strand DNA-binding protein